ncbi:hypothetical protein, partial [Klebsiella pneumoniae]|uniref:hypothetical protein n=1 Tax=Klebsiella pneumoniae TaxID=573 RepID=UPI004055515E
RKFIRVAPLEIYAGKITAYQTRVSRSTKTFRQIHPTYPKRIFGRHDMTVSTEINHNEYTGNGETTHFPYTFRLVRYFYVVLPQEFQ